MENTKSILVIHASDADQHHGNLIKILDTFKAENRIKEHNSLEGKAVNEGSFAPIGKDDMVMLLLTNGIVEDKVAIEQWMLDLKKEQPKCKIAEVIIDNVPYETSFYALPESLEPIRSTEDMDSVWKQIQENLETLFPKPVAPPIPTPTPPSPTKPSRWKKLLPYIFGVVALLVIFFTLNECLDRRATKAKVTTEEVTPVNAENSENKVLSYFAQMVEKVLISKKQMAIEKLGAFLVYEKNGQKNVKFSYTKNEGLPIHTIAMFVNVIAVDTGISKAETEDIIYTFINTLHKNIQKGEETSLEGLGTWSVSIRAAREGRNPATNEIIKIPEKRTINFKTDSKLVEALNKK